MEVTVSQSSCRSVVRAHEAQALEDHTLPNFNLLILIRAADMYCHKCILLAQTRRLESASRSGTRGVRLRRGREVVATSANGRRPSGADESWKAADHPARLKFRTGTGTYSCGR